MAVGIMMPQPKQPTTSGGGLSKLMTIGGMAAGAYFGGPTGAALGGQLGGMAGGIVDPVKQEAAPPSPGPVGGAIERRMSQLDQSPQRQIRESIDSLKYIPDANLRAELAQPLLKAQQASRMRG